MQVSKIYVGKIHEKGSNIFPSKKKETNKNSNTTLSFLLSSRIGRPVDGVLLLIVANENDSKNDLYFFKMLNHQVLVILNKQNKHTSNTTSNMSLIEIQQDKNATR